MHNGYDSAIHRTHSDSGNFVLPSTVSKVKIKGEIRLKDVAAMVRRLRFEIKRRDKNSSTQKGNFKQRQISNGDKDEL